MSQQQPQSDPKGRLQAFTQRVGMQLPVYQTYNELNQQAHLPQFRSRLWVDGTMYVLPTASSSKKAAERSVAEHAFVAVVEKVKNEARDSVKQDTMLCKQIVNEYAVKINVEAPEYTTERSNPVIPLFISSISLNGATFKGDPGKNKKEAEHSAARAAILSILESETGTNTMLVHAKSKFKHYEELMLQVNGSSTGQEQCTDSLPAPEPDPVSAQMVPLEDPNQSSSLKRARVGSLETTSSVPYPVHPGLPIAAVQQSSAEPLLFQTLCSSASTEQISQPIPQPLAPVSATPNPVNAQMVPSEDPNPISALKRIRVEPIEATSLVTSSAQHELSIATVPHSSSEPLPFPIPCYHAFTTNQISQLISQPLHVFNRTKPVQTSVANAVTPIAFVPASTETLAPVLSTSAKKRKNKKRGRKGAQRQAVSAAGSLPPNQVPICKA